MQDKASTWARWAARLAVVTMVCGGIIGAAFLMPFHDSGEFSGLFHAMVVGLVTVVFGGIGLICSSFGAVLTVLAIRKHRDWGSTTRFAAAVHSLAFVAIGGGTVCISTMRARQKRGGETKLAYAVMQQDVETVRSQLRWGANPNQKTYSSREPLLWTAVGQGNNEIVALLLEHGARTNDSGAYTTVIQKAVYGPSLEVIKTLLEHGASPGISPDGRTADGAPLIIAVDKTKKLKMSDNDREAMVKMLLEHGADVNVTDRSLSSRTPAYLAAEFADIPILTMLAQHGANLDTVCGDMTPLASAVKRRDTKTVLALIELGADVNAILVDGYTVICCAQDPNMVDLLCTHGADVNRGHNQFWPNALGRAVQRNRRAMVEALLAHGADVNFRQGNGKAVIESAIDADNKYMVKLLLEHGADVVSKGEMGSSILHTARIRRNPDIIRMIEEAIAKSKGDSGRTQGISR